MIYIFIAYTIAAIILGGLLLSSILKLKKVKIEK